MIGFAKHQQDQHAAMRQSPTATLPATPGIMGLIALIIGYSIQAQGLAAQTPAPNLELETIQLSDHVYMFRAPSDLDKWTSSNSTVVITDDGVVVFDSNTLPSTTRMVLSRIRALTDQPVVSVINSHWHQDHWSGNEVYADSFPSVQIVATFTTRNFMVRMPSTFFAASLGLQSQRDDLNAAIEAGVFSDGTPVSDERVEEIRAGLEELEVFEREILDTRRVLPTTTYTDSLFFSLGGTEFQLFSLTGDAAGSTVLYLPQENILVAGDVLPRREDGTGSQPWTMNSFAVSEWLAGLRKLDTFTANTIVPGQGPPMYDHSYLRTTIAMYESLIQQTHMALEQGAVGWSEVLDTVDVEEFRRRYAIDGEEATRVFESVVRYLVRKIIEEAHDGVRPPA